MLHRNMSGRASALNLPTPFTNDPLGWRKAKNTYQAKDTPSTEKKSADDRP